MFPGDKMTKFPNIWRENIEFLTFLQNHEKVFPGDKWPKWNYAEKSSLLTFKGQVLSSMAKIPICIENNLTSLDFPQKPPKMFPGDKMPKWHYIEGKGVFHNF